MSRARQYDTPWAILRRIKEGRGAGEGVDFKPWTEAKDVPTRGRSHRFFCVKNGRTVHLLSDLERAAHFLGEYLSEVICMKEQVPLLPLSETKKIAKRLRIKRHSTSPRTQFPVVMTTDQIWIVRGKDGTVSEFAINVKYVEDREMPRNKAKRRIEKAYHARRHRPLLDFDENVVSDDFIVNWGFIRTLLRPDYADPKRDALAAIINRDLRNWVRDTNPRQADLVTKAAVATGATKREVITALHALIATRVWPVDIFNGRLGPSLHYRFLAT